MPTTVLQIAYRPMRLAFLVRPRSRNDVIHAIRLCSLLWGGGFNPIVRLGDAASVDRDVAELEIDALQSVTTTPASSAAQERHRYLHWPYIGEGLIVGEERDRSLGVQDFRPMLRMVERTWRADTSVRPSVLPRWDPDDPFAAIFAATFGDLSLADDLMDRDVAAWFIRATGAVEDAAASAAQSIDHVFVPLEVTRLALTWRIHPYRERPDGVFVGNAASTEDVCAYWNLRACGHRVLFWHRNEAQGGPFGPAIATRIRALASSAESSHPHFDAMPVFSLRARGQSEIPTELRAFADERVTFVAHSLRPDFGISPWRHLRLVDLPSSEAQGVLSHVDDLPGGRSKVVVPLPPLPFPRGDRADRQALVISVGTYSDAGYRGTLRLPPLPDLNHWYRWEVTETLRPVRAAAETFGVIDDLLLETLELSPLPRDGLVRQLFERAGIAAKRSLPGEAAHHLMQQLGGLGGCAVLRIPGVRKLLGHPKSRSGVLRRAAHELIRDRGSFASAGPLRMRGERATPADVFSFLVASKLFLPGLELKCQRCQHASFYPMRDVDDDVRCPRCAFVFALGPVIVGDPIRFRVSALLDDRKDGESQPSAVPVLLTLLFLGDWLSVADGLVLETSHDLNGTGLQPCETDFVALSYGSRPDIHTHILVGECKGAGLVDADDLEKLEGVVQAVRASGVGCDAVIATTRETFTEDELALCRGYFERSSEVEPLRRAPILLTRRELDATQFRAGESERNFRFHGIEGLVELSRDRNFSAEAARDGDA
jgi:hypothetical protein